MKLTGKRIKIVSLGIITGIFLSVTVFAYNSNNEEKSKSSISMASSSTKLSDTEQHKDEENFIKNETAKDDNTILPGKDTASDQSIADEASGKEKLEKSTNDSKVINSEEKTAESKQNNNDDIKSNESNDTKKDNETSNLIIAQVDNYVNIREKAGKTGGIIGKLYDESVGTVLDTKGDWLKIKSGCVTGYVNSEFVLSGKKAEALAEKVGQKMAKVTTTTLKVRKEPSLEAEVLGLVPEGDILTVSKELEGWVKVSVEEGDGYVSSDYVMIYIQNTQAESKEDEEARLKKEEVERQQAVETAERQRAVVEVEKKNTDSKQKTTEGSSNNLGESIAEYALQFVGNPYVYGGTSLTNGADCSGFVMGIYKKFGLSLPRTSGEQGQKGSRINGLENAKPGDLIWYSGHIGIYIGNGKLVSASNSKPYPQGGIKITNANYRPILSIRRIF